MQKPCVGDKFYYPTFDVYYDNGIPYTSLRIVELYVRKIIHGGYTAYQCRMESGKAVNIMAFKLSDLNKTVFYTRKEAYVKAEQLADEWDKNWEHIEGRRIRREYGRECE